MQDEWQHCGQWEQPCFANWWGAGVAGCVPARESLVDSMNQLVGAGVLSEGTGLPIHMAVSRNRGTPT